MVVDARYVALPLLARGPAHVSQTRGRPHKMPVSKGALAEGWRIQRDTPGYGPRHDAEQLRADLAAAKRYRDM